MTIYHLFYKLFLSQKGYSIIKTPLLRFIRLRGVLVCKSKELVSKGQSHAGLIDIAVEVFGVIDFDRKVLATSKGCLCYQSLSIGIGIKDRPSVVGIVSECILREGEHTSIKVSSM